MADSVPIFQYFSQQNSQPTYTLTTNMTGLTGPAGEIFTPVSIEGDILQFMVAPYPINVLKYTLQRNTINRIAFLDWHKDNPDKNDLTPSP